MKKNHDEKNLCISVKSVGQNPPTKKNLRHLRNLRDKKKQIYTDDSPRFYTFYLVISLFNHTFASKY